MTREQPRFDWWELTTAVALCAPAVRMVVVAVWAERFPDGTWGSDDHEIYPVLAIQARQRHCYRRPYTGSPARNTAPEHDALVTLGWTYDGDTSGLEYDALIWTEDYGLTDASLVCKAENMWHDIIPCPWSVEEDEEQLAPIIEGLRNEARSRVEKAEQAESKGTTDEAQ
jgi:hypothetical protein